MDVIDSLVGKALEKGLASLLVICVILAYVLLQQRQTDAEQSRILAETSASAARSNEALLETTTQLKLLRRDVDTMNEVDTKAARERREWEQRVDSSKSGG